jgi:putative oxidoreductase
MLSNLAASWQPRLLSLLRIVTALLLLQHGTAKLFGFAVDQRQRASVAALT